ncbi:ABC transporter substrate-binding protein [Streptomyces sp. AJS327]|uniref:peptide ABC transporter substrate-binding protein n=1 Tax=Streptomyces sp. AJS327 TaxID=2545265 RepID=UPI0015DD5971|nr:ABC transporter substrate-binding protein [Streptomyces sp. AJS327]MBA0051395.1 ABC transporter substrate-binding protein [Streptomyces sp. AJS327]
MRGPAPAVIRTGRPGARYPRRLAVVGVVVALAAGCGGGGGGGNYGSGDGGGGAGDVVRASWTDPQNPLEPGNTNEVQGGKVMDMIFEGLMEYDAETGEAKEAVAESIDTDDQRNFTVKLKKGRTFSDGTKVTAKSFVDAWNYAALVSNKQVNAYFFQYIEGYEDVHPSDEGGKPSARTMSGLRVKDDHTFTVRLTQKFSQWPETLGYRAFAPLPRAFFTDHDGWLDKPVGNGPYRVDRYTKGQSMKLVRNKEYRGDEKPKNGGVELKVYTDNNTAYTDLQASNVDVVDDVPASQLKNAKKDLGDRYVNQPAGIIQTIGFPLYDEGWSGQKGVDLRRGLSMAINREEITKKIYHGTRVPAGDYTSPVLGERGGFDKEMCGETCTYQPGKAKRLIEDAGGLPGGKVTLTSNVDTGSHRQWMDAVCNSINDVLGKNNACAVNPISTFGEFRKDVFGKKMKGPFRSGWQMDYPLIQNFLQPIYYSDASSNDTGFSDKRADGLMDKANAESGKKAISTFQDAQRQILKQLPAIPLWYQNGTAGFSERVSGVRLDPFSVPDFTQIEVH